MRCGDRVLDKHIKEQGVEQLKGFGMEAIYFCVGFSCGVVALAIWIGIQRMNDEPKKEPER